MIKEPTLEQLDRIFFLYAKMMLESFGKDKPMSYEERNNYILNNWNNDEEAFSIKKD